MAGLQNVLCVNLNELARYLKVEMIPGEIVQLKIVREGREKGQGIGYLPDGTMVVVSNGQSLVGSSAEVQIKSTVQTGAGVLVFGDAQIGETK